MNCRLPLPISSVALLLERRKRVQTFLNNIYNIYITINHGHRQVCRETEGSVVEIANAIVNHAVKNRTKDDVTALVIRVWPAAEWMLRSPTTNLDDGQLASFES